MDATRRALGAEPSDPVVTKLFMNKLVAGNEERILAVASWQLLGAQQSIHSRISVLVLVLYTVYQAFIRRIVLV